MGDDVNSTTNENDQAAYVSLDGDNPVPAANGADSVETNGLGADELPERNSPLCEDRIRDELKKVIDPELFVNIVDLGLVYVVDLVPNDEGKMDVNVEMTLTSPMCPAGPQLVNQSQVTIEALDGVGSVSIRIVMDPPWTPDRMTEDARDQLGIF